MQSKASLLSSDRKKERARNYKYEDSYNDHLITKITNDGTSMSITYDSYGNSIGTTLSSSSASVGKIVSTATYGQNGSQLSSQTDANGKKIDYLYIIPSCS